MHSSDTKQYLTASDLTVLRRILDEAGVPSEADQSPSGREKRDEAARFLIALFQQGMTEGKLKEALKTSMTTSSPVTSRGYQMAREQFHAGPTPTVATAGGYRYGRRVEKNGTWTIYHVFSGVPAEYASWKMVGLHVKTAERALRILNAPAHVSPAT